MLAHCAYVWQWAFFSRLPRVQWDTRQTARRYEVAYSPEGQRVRVTRKKYKGRRTI
jgi:hypothetical protein